uniref:Uncharacterized protein n=1 Tax=Rhizophora mucronata TaxID=61149 RepID=A0A2P2JC90_RHIMU
MRRYGSCCLVEGLRRVEYCGKLGVSARRIWLSADRIYI